MANNVVTVKIQGLEDIERKLYDLPTKLAKLMMRRALRPAAMVWRDEFAARAPDRTGFLKTQAAISIKLSAKEESGGALVGFTKKQNPAAALEHKAHSPSAANEAFWYELGTVKQPARPFMRPAFELKKQQVLSVFVARAKEAFAEIFK